MSAHHPRKCYLPQPHGLLLRLEPPTSTKTVCPASGQGAFYELRAKGGAAAVTMSELVVHPETDGSHMLHLDLATVGSLAAFTFTADAIKRHGAVPSVEFSHSGQYAGTYMADKDKKRP